jgi:GntR family transcriptional regulator
MPPRLLIPVSITGPEPLYEQVKQGMRHAILRGDLAEGDPVASFRGLAAELRVSMITVKRAYDDLVAEGVLATRQGKGTYVAEGALEACRASASDEIRNLVEKAVGIARLARMSEEEVVQWLKKIAPSPRGRGGWG